MFRLNNADEYEPLKVQLTERDTPIAFQAKIDELMEQGAFENEDEAKKWLSNTPIELEIYYEKDNGLFAVESEAVESGTIYSPYTGDLGDNKIN